MLDTELKSKINKLWDAFWSGGISNPLPAIEQISYLIFIKRLDDLDTYHKNAAKASGHEYNSLFKGHEDCRWSNWKYKNAEDMLKHFTEVVFPFIKNLRDGEDALYSEYMKDAVFLIQKASLLQQAVSLIDQIEITDKPDIQGDIYEYLLKELKTSGKNGQFRTPRHIIRMMVKLIDPDIGERICDPACGTGGFLIAAYQHILEKYTSEDIVKIDPDGTLHNLIGNKITKKQYWDILRKETFYGFDFEITMVRISLMNMILHGITEPHIQKMDTLSKHFDQKPIYDIVLANPPFAGNIDKSEINDAFKIETTATELLFLELFYNILKVGGRAAVIVPNGILFGSSNAHIRIKKLLLENCELQAVISMPSGIFQPYSGVSTAILVFVKGGKTEKVWFYGMKDDGYSLDQKRDFIDGKGDIPDIIQKFKSGKIESEKSVLVPFKIIKENGYNLSISNYKEADYKEVKYETPQVLIKDIKTLEKEISDGINTLEKMIKNEKL